MLNYETLIANPEKVMRELCDFLHLPYTDKVMDYYKSKESANTAVAGKMWANVTKPILKDNTKKFLRELSAEDIAIFESVAGNVLQRLGYTLCTSAEQLRDSFSDEEIEAFNKENIRLKNEFIREVDPVDLEKRRPQDELLKRIKQYKDK